MSDMEKGVRQAMVEGGERDSVSRQQKIVTEYKSEALQNHSSESFLERPVNSVGGCVHDPDVHE